jgi:hypothetical protein
VTVSEGTYRATSSLFGYEGLEIVGTNQAKCIVDFDIADGVSDGVVFTANTYTNQGAIRNLTLQSTTGNVRDVVSLVHWVHFELADCTVFGASRNCVNIATCIATTIRRCDLVLAGISNLYVDGTSTTTRVYDTYMHLAFEGPGADIAETDFHSCIFESNGQNYSYTSHGVQDPLKGMGLRGRKGNVHVFGGHFENNAGHAIALGTSDRASASLFAPHISGDVLNFTQPTAAAVWADQVLAGVFLGLAPYITRSIVFTANSRNVAVLGLNVLNGGIGASPPEYINTDWLGNPTDITFYPGVVQYRDRHTGVNVLVGGNGTVQGLDCGSVSLVDLEPNGGAPRNGKLFFGISRDITSLPDNRYLWWDGSKYELKGGKLSVDSLSDLTPGASIVIDKPSGSFQIASGITSFVVNNALATIDSQPMVMLRGADATAQIQSVVPANGHFTINLVAPTLDVIAGFVLFN